ncbi:RDD family protein [Metabacillus sp. RGM 3146]|uniref:RDD family protein n=1 Tax=Metabacillus sp. RGM 3146 TaxID=3401092 RepID=UPI003B9D9A01
MDTTYDSRMDHHLPSESAERFEMHYSGFWIRFWAYLIDVIIIGSVVRIIVNPLFVLMKIPTNDKFIFSPISILDALIFFLYFVLLTKYFQQTLGKMIFGIKVISLNSEGLTWSKVLFRELVGRYISKTIFILYLVTAFTPKKQGVHDLFADTSVIHENTFKKVK